MACNSINSTIEIFTLMILCVLMAAILLNHEKIRWNKIFFFVILIHIINTSGDLLAWRLAGKPGRIPLIITTCGNYITYLFSVFAYTGFMVLVFYHITKKERVQGGISKVLVGLISAIALFQIGLITTNHWTGVLYHLSADNTFTWGRWCTLYDNLVLVQLCLLMILILCNQTYGIKKTVSNMLLYLAAPLTAIILENWYTVLMLLYPSVALSLLLIYINEKREQEKQMLEQRLELVKGQTALMLSQMQPHFLYNSLAVIDQLCKSNPTLARKAVSSLSDYLRCNLNSLKKNSLIPFMDELHHIESYLELEKMRFGKLLTIKYDIQSDVFLVPSLSVQPLVENAVKHGLGDKEEGGTVTIATREHEDRYEIIIEDDGVGFVIGEIKGNGEHIGIENITARLKEMCGGVLDIESRVGQGTKAIITIYKKVGEKNEYTCH